MAGPAAGLAARLLSPLGDRWRHTVAVAARARELAATVPAAERDLLVDAAWVHDLGYAPELAVTGFHPLDGARHLASRGFPVRLCALVAHHSGARFEAAQRGLSRELAAFPLEDSPVLDALVTADLTTGPQGQRLAFGQRIDEILARYPPDSPVHQAIVLARPVLAAHVARAADRLTRLR